MNKSELLKMWMEEERVAHIHGWDFSHIQGKFEEEFPGFSVAGSLERLFAMQEKIDRDGVIDGTIHRFLIVARKEVF